LELGFLLLEPVADEVEVSLSLIIDNIWVYLSIEES
jgi:hypothetical protein